MQKIHAALATHLRSRLGGPPPLPASGNSQFASVPAGIIIVDALEFISYAALSRLGLNLTGGWFRVHGYFHNFKGLRESK